MSVPVAFNDIGKSAKDLLTKDFPVGNVKLEVKTTAPNGVIFKVNGNRDNKTGIIVGDIETKFADKKNGITLTEAWTTSNVLNGKVELENNLAKGLKLELLTSLLPSVNERAAKINAIYKKPNVHTVATLDVFKTNFNVNTVFSQRGYLVGTEVAYNILDGKIGRYNAAVGYAAAEHGVAFHLTNNLTNISASYYHHVNSDLEASGRATWDSKGANAVALEVGAKLKLDSTAFVKAKISNAGVLGLAYTQSLRPGVKVNLGASIDTTRLNENAHKLGLSLTLEN
ncbi:eukaryotic porin/Tom40 [Mycotypha africana]|uniref:eukaryotic porin/Tom40 n=1 Tax=Mycotypha africana TaxID=64632 RepID=UPI0022FFE480|nr:eukaryotic porin/Tom40 [Mycotypha africana]KAI8973620.1 eukaryotic porin/Tom40 [Mycotypha africana]